MGKLWSHWKSRSAALGPGDEYKLVDEFADMVGLREWYEWRLDPGKHEATAEPVKSGTTNPELLKAKYAETALNEWSVIHSPSEVFLRARQAELAAMRAGTWKLCLDNA